jgi:hypothetical protein
MNAEQLKERIEMLQQEIQKSNGNLNLLNEQVEKTKIHLHTVTGHMNEAIFILNQMNPTAEAELPSDEAPAVIEGESCEANNEEAQQLAE